ncbi:DUF3127 domain-containing protein [Cryomorpha ignava]|uniref:DUF3127 domain-containing protein n=1 Tax=Cryomorpha ignava TaxID=101383 RepID=A0A7K3WR31_9FLAO|nr:DUF3127 domain-containing protein [Cryomorpha ignava]NEN23988.1 DUF3127 domain-containing protein [Cryomorpha ignava]
MFTINGKLIVKNDAEQITDSFKKREFVISDDGSQYPQEIMFQLVQDKCDLIEAYNIGDEIKVNFNLRGRRWENPKTNETKFFVSLDAWRLEKVSQESAANNLPPLPTQEPAHAGNNDDSDDLPF